MKFNIAFDESKNLEIILYRKIHHKDGIMYSGPLYQHFIAPIGTFLTFFLDIDFDDDMDFLFFIYRFCFESLYTQKYFNKQFSHLQLSLPQMEFYNEISSITDEEKENFLYVKNIFLKNLNLPYDKQALICDDEEEDIKNIPEKTITEIKNWEEEFKPINYDSNIENDLIEYDKPDSTRYDDSEITTLIESLSLNFSTFDFIFGRVDISKYNFSYSFESSNIVDILAIEFKKFKENKKNIIRRCQNCGQYFIPQNLKETKYCNEIFEETEKTCRQIGKELAYKKSLKEDKILDLYRRRYMSLASSVSHYGTDKAIERFEKYKTEGAIMKAKYQNKEISAEEFENWIHSTKNKGKIN